MTKFNTVILIAFIVFVNQCHEYRCQYKAQSKAKDEKPEIEFPIKDNLPKNQVGMFIVNGIKNLIDGKNQDGLNTEVEKQIKLHTNIWNIYSLVQEVSEDTDNADALSLLKATLAQLSTLFDKIESAHSITSDFKKSNTPASDFSVQTFIENTKNPYQGPIDYLETIYAKVLPRDTSAEGEGIDYLEDVSVISLISNHMKNFKRMCDKHKSQQQILHMLYTSLQFAARKVYSIIEYTYKKLSELGKCDYEKEMASVDKRHNSKGEQVAKIFEQFMRNASREVWRCDPKVYKEDFTFTRLNKVFQKYVISDMNMDNTKECSKTCSDFNKVEATECINKDEEFYDGQTGYEERSICDQQRKCNGLLYGCENTFEEFKEIWICPSHLNSTRRYEFIQHGEESKMQMTWDIRQYGRPGTKKSCERKITYDYTSIGGRGWGDMVRQCEVCTCTCDDFLDSTSERRLNFRPQVADPGYVVTGVRLVKIGNELNLQIEQGKLDMLAHIEHDSIGWKDIAMARDVYDLRSINWNAFKQVLLGISEVPKGNVVVGLKFSQLKNGGNTILGLKTLSKPYDYNSGTLTYDGTYYQEPKGKPDFRDPEFDPLPDYENNPIKKEAIINIDNSDLPDETEFASLPQPEWKKIVEFTTSDFRRDLGQNTIPFIDIQNVTVRPAVPLSGVGFYHKNRIGYGGFLGIKLLTFDASSYL